MRIFDSVSNPATNSPIDTMPVAITIDPDAGGTRGPPRRGRGGVRALWAGAALSAVTRRSCRTCAAARRNCGCMPGVSPRRHAELRFV
ncbi:hypothetical protein ACU686_43235 [Yinghuangia aomiensis]